MDTRGQPGRMGRTGRQRQKGPLDKGTRVVGTPNQVRWGREGGRSEDSGLRVIGTELALGRGHHTELSSAQGRRHLVLRLGLLSRRERDLLKEAAHWDGGWTGTQGLLTQGLVSA